MAGIYIHIPFCKSKCGYCNFFSVASLRHGEKVVSAIIREIELTADDLQNEPLESIYFGGGTPSLLSTGSIAAILKTIAENHTLQKQCEITLEANPDDLSSEKLSEYIALGIRRISLGIQSFNEQDLGYLERKHDPAHASWALDLLGRADLDSYSIDLIYGIPGQTEAMLRKNLDICIEAGVPHISCYSLTVEEKTALHSGIRKGIRTAPDEDTFMAHYELITSALEGSGYLHYEISNFAREGHLAVHNTNYWLNKRYLGIGPSAHSYDLSVRRWNHAGIKPWLDGIEEGNATAQLELLTPVDQYNELIMTRLRTMWGLSLTELNGRFGNEAYRRLTGASQKWIDEGFMEYRDGALILTRKGKPLSDHIIADLFTA
jgi:oxygen-independent coproporphyrinogen III oxidase